MKLKRIVCLCLACIFCVLPLCSCSDGGDEGGSGGGINDDGSVNWEEVDFKGATVKFAISANQDPEVTFGPADVYLQGPDKASTDEVHKKVTARNNKVEKDLNIRVDYIETNLAYNQVLDDIKMKVQGSAADAPDLYNNDMYGLNRAIIPGYLMNVINPVDAKGNPQESYFDFTYDGWNYDFMKEDTLDSSKVYILAGDYYLDMIRMAWVLYVNKTMFNQYASVLGASSVDEFYDYVEAGIWDYDMMTDMCDAIWYDSGATKDKVDKDDGRIGLALHNHAGWILSAATGLTTFYIDDDGKAAVLDDIYEYNIMSGILRDLCTKSRTVEGVYHTDIADATNCFIGGKFLFAQSVLGEMESDALRNVDFEKGVIPYPKYTVKGQSDYHTILHDQTELGAILVTTRSFARASAFMQYANEQSRDVLTEYYEFSLKFKYNDDPAIRGMIDLIYDSIDAPFGMQFENIILAYGTDLAPLYHVISYGETLSSLYESNKQAYEIALEKAMTDFAKIP